MGLPAFNQTLTDLLDVREAATALRSPILGAVNIPFRALAEAAGELPPRGRLIRVVDKGPEASQAVQLLSEMERSVVLEPGFAHGENLSFLRLWEPNPFLLEALPSLPKGSALDLACGGGREAVTLASLGWRVTAVDHLPDALERAERLAIRFGTGGRVHWLQADLETWQPPSTDLALMFFFLDRQLIERTLDRLNHGGSLLLETFTPTHRERFGKPRHLEYVISAEELGQAAGGLEVVHLSEAWRESGRHTVRLWARLS